MRVSTQTDELKSFNDRSKAAGWAFTCGPAQDFEHADLTGAHAVWRDKARGRPMPFRADLTVRAMKAFITHMSLLERVSQDGRVRFRIRLHGSALARYAGDSTGQYIDDVVAAPRLESFHTLYDMVLRLGQPLRVVSYYQAPEVDYLMGESLLAPLAVAQGEAPMLLSVTYAKPRPEFTRASLRHSPGLG